MIGNFQAAVEACIRIGRMADALVLSPDFFVCILFSL
jgi:hypothetical protein